MNSSKADYIYNLFKKIYGIKHDQINISYGVDDKSKIQIRKANVDFSDFSYDVDLSHVIRKQWNNTEIPFLFDRRNAQQEIMTIHDEHIVINFDIIAGSFYFLSGFQELNPFKRDSLGRFCYKKSIQFKLGIVKIPVVNYYFDILKQAIEKAYNTKLQPVFSQNSSFIACLTHDIDNCENAWLEGSYHALRKGNIFTPFNLLFHKFVLQKDKWFNFEDIHAVEKEYEANSSFYFLCKKGKYLGKNNADYEVTHKKFVNVMDRIESVGSEIGIHGSFGTHLDGNLLLDDIRKLNRKVYGGRFHFLEFDIAITPEIIYKAGLTYDSTLGFAEHPGFRNSFCYPFLLYDFKNDRTSQVWEIPLVLMDSSLQSKNYLKMSSEESPVLIDELTEEIKKFNGIFTILWHTTFFSDYKYAGWKSVYFYFLKKCKEHNVKMSSAKTIIATLTNR